MTLGSLARTVKTNVTVNKGHVTMSQDLAVENVQMATQERLVLTDKQQKHPKIPQQQ